MRLLILALISFGSLNAATVHQGTLALLTGSADLDPVGAITAGSAYDGGAGSCTDGTRVTGGIDFGDTYTPVNPSFTGGLFGNANGTSAVTPNFGDAQLNEVIRTQAYGANLGMNLALPNGTYKIQLLFWEPYFGLQVAGAVGSRVFNIVVEGQPSVTGLDLIAQHGSGVLNKGVIYTQVVSVTDGSLDINLTGTTDNATFAGIVVSSAPTTATGPADVIGTEDFAGTSGTIAGRNAGEFFDFDNSTADDAFLGHEGPRADWNNVAGAPTVASQALVTQNSSAKREYNATSEARGAVSPAADRGATAVYYKFRMKRAAGTAWSGASSYDFNTERILFGVPDAVNPASGLREFAIHVLNSPGFDGHTYSGIAPTTNANVMLVAKIDFSGHLLSLWREPDLTQMENSQVPIATRAYTAASPSSAIRFGSGGTGGTTWDDLVVATTWSGLTRNGAYPVADSFTMNPGGKAAVAVLRNDLGNSDPASVAVVSPPAFGTATALPDGTIRYVQTTGSPASDNFTYSSRGLDGVLSAPATVTVNFTAAARFSTGFVSLPDAAPATGFALTDAFPGITFDSPHDFATSGNSLFVTEGDGRVWLIPDVTAATPVKSLFLDLTNRVEHDNNEIAMKGIAIHPNYAGNGYIYVTYNHLAGAVRSVRLSRFTRSSGNPLVANAASEVILIDQINQGDFHNISVCRFGQDGYLYVGVGDGGTQEDGFDNSQHIDKNLWSAVLRIDVDKRAGNLAPNPDPDIPGSGTASVGFSIPADNPFVGATSFNGRPVSPASVRTEIFVTGVRNPWQFNFDSVTHELWLGDVGRNDRDEINIFQAGDNGGWAWREGGVAGPRSGQLINGAAQAAATLKAPLHEYGHGGSAFEGQSVTGGIVYRGEKIPSLVGKYIFADYVSGNVWSLTKAPPNTIERLATEQAIVSFAADPTNGDVLLLDRGNTGTNQGIGRILRLVQTANDTSFPATLTATGFFADLADLTPNPGARAYDVNLRFWSDNAGKSRWFLINNPGDVIGWSRDEPWTFPAGMIWVKHFNLELTPGNPATKRRIETRFLVRNTSGSYGVTYLWNNITNGQPQTEATLVGPNGADIPLPSQTWHLPGRGECITCHTPAAGHALSFTTRQLNRPGNLAGQAGNFLTLLNSNGYLAQNPGPSTALPRHIRPDETAYSLEARVRSYLDVNCAYCHRPGGGGGGNWDGRHPLTLSQTGLVNQPSVDAPLHPGDLLVIPGNVGASILHHRAAASNGYSRMPPLATNLIDTEGVQLLADWIGTEANALTSYAQWRSFHFAASPLGAPNQNPDGDAHSNLQEYLFLTDPSNGTGTFQPNLTVANGQSTIPLPALPGRTVTVERSTDLSFWETWNAPGNDGIPRNPAGSFSLTAPNGGPKEFFRFSVREN
ncbi:MAG: PQQ-dependent sugar dehydrogenase [Verrucomicrobiota bacterium]